MPRIAPIETAHADPGVKATLSAVKTKIGMVPNLFSTFARSPAVLNGYVAFSDALGKGVLTAKQREIVALAIGQANECEYCLSAHTLMGKGAGLSPEGIRRAREGKAETAIDAVIASFARRVLEKRGQVTDAEVAAVRSAGLDDARIIEVIANVAINVLTNYTNNVALTDIDFPKVDVALRPAA
ncbi:carboxymuconolactone decarboxylase family protein [Mesorhizobium sp. B3-1-6]|uniref:carboxymuconolactone decarboxylase family protein n=1 Tax=unclassified Mesorhizobium TaxID=325217 RepID=UPI0011263C77|nr:MULTISPECIES: carboxymuconolactone decarboxylase family protein [unclassified Mesorhizobium]TPI34732.1 carboxymuconolactone decarboxylase family protein [Mesorhizobium sp. B3-1-6]TPI58483.1 carboxymuconolactone decarboxylase family protein [Mesorhizobium sp. B3-1-8]TPI67318.1 carboxymuconolactone decarboxylase family protein [Mesorhizobium sp. B3-1-3]TPJ34971.1 carboxymuconolactone decarboxylase family protein [Mesorhizobium sp. B2-8-3]UCI26766.1 carboxymuconolactone decarboxylase family pr